jgi:MoaA/NifB/PqqE/SkfB family radical SAM enzyme
MKALMRKLVHLLPRFRHTLRRLPILVLMPYSGCNCKCIMCDYWGDPGNRKEIKAADLAAHVEDLKRLGTSWVLLSGGEALMHSDLWSLCALFKDMGARISLLTNGLLLERNAQQVVEHCSDVIVSLDGDEAMHDRIRGVKGAFKRLAAGVKALKNLDRDYAVTGRSVVQKANYKALSGVIDAAHALDLDSISFLAVDGWTDAFNRNPSQERGEGEEIMLSAEEAADFEERMEELIAGCSDDIASGYIVESPAKLRRLVRYFAAASGRSRIAAPACNAPWVSTVIEADGSVRPCFFHASFGNIRDRNLEAVLNSKEALSFRRSLKIARNPVCRRCVCPLFLRTPSP